MKKLFLMAALFCFAAAPAAMAQNYETPQQVEQQQAQYAKDADVAKKQAEAAKKQKDAYKEQEKKAKEAKKAAEKQEKEAKK